jgi:hypothetical protein
MKKENQFEVVALAFDITILHQLPGDISVGVYHLPETGKLQKPV